MNKKSDCSKHTDQITHFGNDYEALAEEIGDLRYDDMQLFFKALAKKFKKDADKDLSGGRKKLSSALLGVSTYIGIANNWVRMSWDISKPYMNKKNSK